MRQTAVSAGKLLWGKLLFITLGGLMLSRIENGSSYASHLFVLILALYERTPVLESKRNPSRQAWLGFAMVILSGFFLTGVAGYLTDGVLGLLGYRQETSHYIDFLGSGWSLLFRTSLLAPMAEEVFFRGILLKRLLPHGILFAAIASSFLFAIQHGVLIQVFYAFFVGLFLCAVTYRYGLRWAIVIHILNNLTMSSILLLHYNGLPASYLTNIENILTALGGLSMLLLLKQRREVKPWWRNFLLGQEQTKEKLWHFFKEHWMWTYVLFNVVVMIPFLISPLE